MPRSRAWSGNMVRRIGSNKRGLVAAAAGVVALAMTSAFTLGGFTAAINNSTNTFSSATIQLEENQGATTCFSTGSGSGGSVVAANSGTCSTINLLNGALDQVPSGTALTSTITLTNVGNHATTSASLVGGATCTASAASDDAGYVGSDTAGYCGKVDVTIQNSTAGKCVYPSSASACVAPTSANTLAGLVGTTLTTNVSALAVSGTATYVITAVLDGSATNADQGLSASLPMTWNINQ